MSVRPRGPLPGWRPSTDRQRAVLADLQARYAQHAAEDTLPRSGRGIFYHLRPAGLGHGVTYTKPTDARPGRSFGPMEASPDTVQEVLLLARRAGLIPEEWVADARAPEPLGPVVYDDAADFAATVAAEARGFRLDAQRGQPRHVELWCEAEDLGPRLERVAQPYGVYVYPSGGYGGLKGRRVLAARAARREVPTVVLAVTDLDRHGRRIYTSAAEDAQAWVSAYAPGRPGDWLAFERIAVTRDQAADHGVLDEHGNAEADALPVPVMDAILLDRLDGLLDKAIRAEVWAAQATERRQLPEAIWEALA
jgi:hypothetical protein